MAKASGREIALRGPGRPQASPGLGSWRKEMSRWMAQLPRGAPLAPAAWARVSPSPEAGQIPSRPSGAGAGLAGDEVTAGRGLAGAATPGWGLGSRPWEQAAKKGGCLP